MQLFYNPDLNGSSMEVSFSPEESRHIIKVLRKNLGDLLHITNGNGGRFEARITHSDFKRCVAQITYLEESAPPSYGLHMAIAPTKMNDRFEWFLEKATEIGVHRITPILCERSERKVIKPERFQKVLRSAMKQSLQTFLPHLNPLTKFDDFVPAMAGSHKFIAHCNEGEKVALAQKVPAHKEVLVLIGPEGDFSEREVSKALAHGFQAVSLGQQRLRTETAGLMACATVALTNG